jgi:murein DD-endopeptidase MepM/ murein hydrolase activator NlpD
VRKLLCVVLILLFTSQTLAYAEPGSTVLDKYNIPYRDAAEEGQRLQIMEQEYHSAVYKVNTDTMLSAAIELRDDYSNIKLKEMDQELYRLSDKLRDLEQVMARSKNADIATIIEMDTSYRNVYFELEQLNKQRQEWVQQSKPAESISMTEIEKNKKKMASLSVQVDRQRQAVEQASSCQDIGNVSSFRLPLNTLIRITSPYGMRLDPVTRENMAFHKGMDLQASEGTPVLAAFHGQVEEVSANDQIGNYVIVNHGCGIKTLYGHLSSSEVKKDQKVSQHQIIAKSGNTGTDTTGPHLHFGLFLNGSAVDPALLLPGNQ